MTSEDTPPELDDLANRMTSEQVAEAQRAAGAFLATYRIDSYTLKADSCARPRRQPSLDIFTSPADGA